MSTRGALKLAVAIGALTGVLHVADELSVLRGGDPGFLGRLELTALDLKFRHRGARPPEKWGVAVIGADERAIRSIGRLPWSRAVHAELTDELVEAGAAAIAFDMTFEDAAERHPPEPALLEALARASEHLASVRAPAAAEARADLEAAVLAATSTVGTPAEDARFAEAIAAASNVVLGVFAHSRVEAEAAGPAALSRSLSLVSTGTISELISEGEVALIRPDSREAFEAGIYRRFYGVAAPTEPLASAARGFGTINALPDVDGVYRRVPVISAIKGKGVLLPTLSLAAISAGANEPIEVIAPEGEPSPHMIRVGPLSAELELGGNVTLDWYGGFTPEEMPIYSAADVLAGRLPEGAVAGRIAFIAATAVGTYDQRVTPFGTSVPGVVVHATLAQNLLDGRRAVRPQWGIALELLGSLGIAVLCGLLLSRLGAFAQIGAAAAIALGWVLLDRYVFFERGWIIVTVLPVLQVGVTLVAVASYRFLVEERERRKTRDAFRQYLSPAVMEQVLRDPEEYLRLGGKRCEATVLFSDIRGFTTFSEGLTPEALGNLLNRYMTPMTDLVFEHGGTLDKYIGDAVMAFWGAPLPQEDHAVRAAKTALRMIEKLRELNVELEQAKLPRIAIGIGLSSGPMTIGNMGSDEHFSYTALGDRVNLGSRLEGQTKEYGVDILISEATYALVKDRGIVCRELGALRVKGKKEPVGIYELLSDRPLEPERRAFVDAFHEGLALFRARKFVEAIAAFERARSLAGPKGDKTTDDYLEECRELIDHPPPADWDGVRTAKGK